MSRSLEIITIQRDELVSLINAAVGNALADQHNRQAADCGGLSLNGAARLARRRRETVQQALDSGALPGRRYGTSKTRPRWSVVAADVRAWLAAGCPTTKAEA
jgi:hypothetical protein